MRLPTPARNGAKKVGERLADGEDHLEDADDDDQKEQRTPDAVQQDVVDLARALDRERGAVAGAAAHLRGPGVRAGGVAHDGQGERLGGGAFGLLVEEERNGVQAGSVDGADLGHGRAQFAGQFEGVDVAAAGLHQVAHVEQHQGGQAQRQHRRGQHQLAGQVQGIEDQQHRVRLGRADHLAAQHVDGDAGVLAVGVERVDAGQVDERQVWAAHPGHQAHALLDGDAGEVGHLLAQAG
jgi:hypothetical protein